MNQRREQAWAKWRHLISEQAQSGQSVAAFCRDRGLGTQFFYWKKRLQEAVAPQFVELQLGKARVEPRVQTRAALGTSIEVRLRNGRSLIVPPEFEVSHLRALLGVVECES